MSRLLEALGVTAGAVVLTLLIVVIGSINLFGPVVLGILMFFTAVASVVFSFWLKRRGELLGQAAHVEYATYLRRAAYVLFLAVIIRYKLPDLAPGTFAYVKSWFTAVEQSARRAALERERPHAVPCDGALIGGKGETKYWYHPSDDPLVCYDRAGHHPKGAGELLSVEDRIAQIIDRQRARPIEVIVAKVEPPPATPPPLPQPSAAPEGAWLTVPQPK